MEGLLRYDVNSNLEPGVAERWEIDGDARHVLAAARTRVWSDGKPVTAHDFVFAWRTAVDPATASQYAFIMYPVKNGEAINRGEMPPEALGVRAASDRVLEVELENPIAYFDKLTAAQTYYPIREDFFNSRNGRYARRRRGPALQRAVPHHALGARRELAHGEERALLGEGRDLAQRDRHRVHHAAMPWRG